MIQLPSIRRANTHPAHSRHRVWAFEHLESRQLMAAIAFTPISPSPASQNTQTTQPTSIPQPASLTGVNLHSKPDAARSIYLDFNGHTTSNTSWNLQYTGGSAIITPAFTLDADATSFSESEAAFITQVWARVAEDFAPFDVDVTTQDPGVEGLSKTTFSDTTYGTRVVIGGSSLDWLETGTASSAGVGFLDTFTSASDIPVFVFQVETNDDAFQVAAASSHEVGHSLNLDHDGTLNPPEEYYSGQGLWSPIMGADYTPLNQWSKGEYTSPSNTEDDLAIITSHGLSYRPDDVGDTFATAASVTINTSTTASASGIITKSSDIDFYEFFVGTSGVANIQINPAATGPNLDILARLYDSAGTLLATSNPTGGVLSAFFNLNLSPGAYFVSVDGTGEGNPLTTGYSDYGSLGQYTLDLTVAAFDTAGPVITSISSIPALTASFVPSVDVTFAEPINPSTFTFQDVSLTVNNGANLITAASNLTFTHLTGNTYRVAGLSNFTNFDGHFVLSISPLNISDIAGNFGIDSPTVIAWTRDSNTPILTAIQAPTTPRNTPVSSFTLTFSEPIDLASFTFADLSLTFNGKNVLIDASSGLAITLVSDSTYSVSGLAPLTAADGTYVFAVKTSQLTDIAGNPAASTAVNPTWINDTTPPAILSIGSVSTPRNTAVDSIDIVFNENINLSTLTFADFSLTLNGGANILTASSGITVVALSSDTYRVFGLFPLTAAAGTYAFSVSSAKVADVIGNIGSSTQASVTWLRLNSPPSVKSALTTVTAFEDITPTSIDLTTIFTDTYQDPATLLYAVQVNSTALVNPSITGHTLSFQLAPNAVGSQAITLTATNQDGLTATTSFTFQIVSINDAPSFTASNPSAVNEDSGAQTLSGWVSTTPGPANETGQSVDLIISDISNPSLFTTLPSISSSGTLSYTPAPNIFGASTFKVRAKDSGGTDNGGVDTSEFQTFTITVNPVNDSPSFIISAFPVILEDAGAQSIPGFVTFYPGPFGESTQTPTYSITKTDLDPSLFSVLPSISPDGTLTFTIAPNANGPAYFQIVVTDSGGTANGGVDSSSIIDLGSYAHIDILPVNDAPTITASNPPAINEDAGPQTLTNWAAFSPGPANEAHQTNLGYTLANISNPGLFLLPPSVDSKGTLTYTPAPNANGSSTFTLQVKDSGDITSNTSSLSTFTITVNPVTDPPIIGSLSLGAPSYAALETAFFTATNVIGQDSPVTKVGFYHDLNKNGIAEASELLGPGKKSATVPTTWVAELYAPASPLGQITILAVASDATSSSSAPASATMVVFRSLESNKSIQYIDSRGNTVKASITGGGTLKAQFVNDGNTDPMKFTVDGSTSAKSSLSITVTKGKGSTSDQTSLGDVAVSGGLLAFLAPKVNLTGNLTSSAVIKTLTLNDVAASTQQFITLGGTLSDKSALTFGRLSDITFSSTCSITSFKALDWQDTGDAPDTLLAPGLSSLTLSGRAANTLLGLAKLNGDFEASINIATAAIIGAKTAPTLSISIAGAAQGDWNLRAYKLTTAAVKGAVSDSLWSSDAGFGAITITGAASNLTLITTKDVTSFKAGNISSSNFDVDGALGSLSAIQWLGGSISAAKTGAITITAAASNFTLTASKDVTSFKAGNISSSNFDIDGALGSLSALEWLGGSVSAAKTGAITITGAASDFTLTTTHDVASFKAGTVSSSNLDIGGSLGSLTAIQWLGGSISAAKTGAITTTGRLASKSLPAIAGDFSPHLTISGLSALANAKSVASIAIKGGAFGEVEQTTDWQISGGVGAITIAGNAGSLKIKTLTRGDAIKGNLGHIASFSVTGAAVGTQLDASGNIGAITLGSANRFSAIAAGNITSYTSKGQTALTTLFSHGAIGAVTSINWLGGNINADKLGALTTKGQSASKTLPFISGDLRAQIVLTGQGVIGAAATLASASISGLLLDSMWRINGNSGAISVGAITDSSIFVGVSPAVDADTLPTLKSQFLKPTAALSAFTVTGKAVANPNTTPTFTHSRIAAGTLTNVSLRLIDPSDTDTLGITAATKITTYSRQTGPLITNRFKVANKTAPGIYDTLDNYSLQLVP